MKMFHMTVPDHPDATLEGYLLDCEITLGQEARRPAVLVCPGGGYLYCSPREGEPVALSYAARGFHAFVLRYSVREKAAGFAPLEEVSWAVGYIRENAEAWHIDPEKIAVCGFSAGGHVALASGLMARNRPNAMILGYPATCTPNMPQADFMLKLLEGKQNVTDADAEKYDMPARVTKDAPPMFLRSIAVLARDAQDFLGGFPAYPALSRERIGNCRLRKPRKFADFLDADFHRLSPPSVSHERSRLPSTAPRF